MYKPFLILESKLLFYIVIKHYRDTRLSLILVYFNNKINKFKFNFSL